MVEAWIRFSHAHYARICKGRAPDGFYPNSSLTGLPIFSLDFGMDAGAFLVGLLRICELQEGSSTSRTPGGVGKMLLLMLPQRPGTAPLTTVASVLSSLHSLQFSLGFWARNETSNWQRKLC